MVQVPAETRVAVLPETVQIAGVSDVKLTGKPEVALAVRVRGVPCRAVPGKVKVID